MMPEDDDLRMWTVAIICGAVVAVALIASEAVKHAFSPPVDVQKVEATDE